MTTHIRSCNCQSCRLKHKIWRERRNERMAKPTAGGNCANSTNRETPPDEFLGPILADAINIGTRIANSVQRNTRS